MGYTAQGTKSWIIKITSGDQSTTSNVAANVTDLVLSNLQANSVYTVSGNLNVSCNNTGGVKIASSLPTSSTLMLWMMARAGSATADTMISMNANGTLSGAFCTASQGSGCMIMGTITTGSTAGSFQLQFASGTNTQTSTILQEGTFLLITKVA